MNGFQIALVTSMVVLMLSFFVSEAEERPSILDWSPQAGIQKLEPKLDTIIIPKIDFQDAPLGEALFFLQQQSVELDPEREGVKIWVQGEKPGEHLTCKPELLADSNFWLTVDQLTLREAIRYVTELCRHKVDFTPKGVIVSPITELVGPWTQVIKVPRAVAQEALAQSGIRPPSFFGLFVTVGINLPAETKVIYDPSNDTLIVITEDEDALNQVEEYVGFLIEKLGESDAD